MEDSDIRDVVIKLESSLPTCRVCLNISMEYIEFEATLCVVDGQEITCMEGFSEIFPTVCELPEKSPTNFCVNCGNNLLNAYLFVKQVETANNMLNKVKYFTEEIADSTHEKDENLSDLELDDCTENLKVEIFPDLLDKEFTKLVGHEADTTSSTILEESIKAENEDELRIEYQMDDLENTTDLPTIFEFIDPEVESEDKNKSENGNKHDEELTWMCGECGEMFRTRHQLSEHRNVHKSVEDTVNACAYCEKKFPSIQQRDEHVLFHKYSKPVTTSSDKIAHRCTLCEKDFRTEVEFIDHINVHTGRRPHVCNICSNTFHTEQSLKMHNWRVHTSRDSKKRKGKENEKCQHCQKVVRKSHMKRHMEVHSSTKQFTCPDCEKQFATKFALKAHSVVHKHREFFCHICNKTCLTRFTLRKHIQYIHLSDRKKYQCEDCGLFFQYPSCLKDHQRKHNIKSRFHCPHCDRSYCRKPQLDIHMRYHNNDFPYKCDQCDKCYATKSNLADHIRSNHTTITYDCDKCDQKFKSGTGLRKHKYTHTGYPYTCPMCSVGQTSRSGMKAHLFGVHKDALTENEFNEMFPIIIPKSGYRRPRSNFESK